MTNKSWRDLAILRIADAVLEYEAQCVALSEEMDATGARKFVNDRYPFSMRQYSPYQIWLQELKLLKVFIETKQPAIYYSTWRSGVTSKGQQVGGKTRQLGSKAQKPVPGQMSLL